MISIESFIKSKDKFVNIKKYNGAVNGDYVDGAISLIINGVELIDLSMWDDVVDLWCYILNGVEEISNKRDFECGFPDQPIILNLQQKRNMVLFSVKAIKENRVLVEREEFIYRLCLHMELFFSKISRTSNRYEREITRVKKLLSKL